MFEPLEGRALLSANVTNPLADVTVGVNAPQTVIDLNPAGTIVRFESTLGNFFVQLYDSIVPTTVNNFLSYAATDTYKSHMVHRSVQNPVFNIIQGGGFWIDDVDGYNFELNNIPTKAPIPLEFKEELPNTRGTLAMARTSAFDSATTGFFFNNQDNSDVFNADNPYAVFGATVFGNNTVIDAIAALPTFFFNDTFANTPLRNYTNQDYEDGVIVDISKLILFQDVQATTPTFTVSANNNPALVTASIVNNQLTLTYAPGASGQASITVRMSDSTGTFVEDSFLVTVSGPNAANDSAVVRYNTATQINVLANDSGGDFALNPATVTTVTQPQHGTLALNPQTGVYTYTPNNNYAGTDSFTYTVTNTDQVTTAPATVSIRVNSPPTAANDNVTAYINTPFIATVLANDTDTDGTLVPSTVTVVTQPQHGTVSVNPTTGAITYTPNTGHEGADTFTYTVRDNDNDISNTATVTVNTTLRVNTAPVAGNDEASTFTGTPVNINVLANDSDPDFDGSLDPTSVTIVAQPSHGAASVNAITGAITYTPANGFVGDDSFTYTVRDNDGATSNTATVSINVALATTVVTTGLTGAKQVVFTDADGTLVTIKVGKANAELLFAGEDVQFTQTSKGATVTGTNVTLQTITITDSTAASTLAIDTKGGNNLTDVGQINVTGELKSIAGKGVNLTGGINAQGAVASLALGSLTNAVITLGTATNAKTALTLSLVGSATNSTLTAVTGIKSVSAVDWTRTGNGTSAITTPWLAKLTLKGSLFSNLTLSGVGATKDTLGAVGIKGDLLGGVWRITGSAAAISAINILEAWDAEISGATKGLTTKGNLSGSLTATTLGSLTVGGNATNATLFFITFANPQTPKVKTIGKVAIKGTANGLNLRSAGNVGAVTIGALYNSIVSAGVYFDIETMPESIDDLFAPAEIASVKINGIKGQEFGFMNSLISAAFLGATTINFPNLDNGETPFGVAAANIKSLVYKDANISLKISTIQQLSNIPAGDFEVRILD